MSRTAQDVLEFDKLRELLRLRTTCVPGRRGIDALEPGTDRVALESAFAHIREAREWLRSGRELGFGGLADPQHWLDRVAGTGSVLEAREFLDASSLLETAGWLILNGPAISLTDASPTASRDKIARRVGSASAAKTASRFCG